MDRRELSNRLRAFIVAVGMVIALGSVSDSAWAADASAESAGRKPFAGKMTPEQRHPLLEAWKAQKNQASVQPVERGRSKFAVGGAPIVGRASMVINSGAAWRTPRIGWGSRTTARSISKARSSGMPRRRIQRVTTSREAVLP